MMLLNIYIVSKRSFCIVTHRVFRKLRYTANKPEPLKWSTIKLSKLVSMIPPTYKMALRHTVMRSIQAALSTILLQMFNLYKFAVTSKHLIV